MSGMNEMVAEKRQKIFNESFQWSEPWKWVGWQTSEPEWTGGQTIDKLEFLLSKISSFNQYRTSLKESQLWGLFLEAVLKSLLQPRKKE